MTSLKDLPLPNPGGRLAPTRLDISECRNWSGGNAPGAPYCQEKLSIDSCQCRHFRFNVSHTWWWWWECPPPGGPGGSGWPRLLAPIPPTPPILCRRCRRFSSPVNGEPDPSAPSAGSGTGDPTGPCPCLWLCPCPWEAKRKRSAIPAGNGGMSSPEEISSTNPEPQWEQL